MKGMKSLTKKDLIALIELYCNDNNIKENQTVATLFYCCDTHKDIQQQCIMFNKELYNHV